jgi:hypothetical protein
MREGGPFLLLLFNLALEVLGNPEGRKGNDLLDRFHRFTKDQCKLLKL